ncbi:hypothetical protein [Salinimonas lutimaris]|uniref:hypothetical protein n=1 Tax=Salinimonas lutimaris TaxID=914153 RepID=UPI0010C057BE|nr:hypothetical protein [Salinimonas lutimaris]
MKPSLAIISEDGAADGLATTQLLKEGIQSQSVTVNSLSIKSAINELSEMAHYDGFIFNQGPSASIQQHEFSQFKQASLSLADTGAWQNKVAAGLVPLQLSGMQRITALLDLSMFCARHHMIWVSTEKDEGHDQYNSQAISGNTVRRMDTLNSSAEQIAYRFGQKIACVTRLWCDNQT